MNVQKTLVLRLPPDIKIPARERRWQEEILNQSDRVKIQSSKLLADLLKRQCRSILDAVTTCPADTVPAHLARLADWRETVEHLLRHELRETPESRRSDKALTWAETLADWLAAAEITRRSHRAPVFVTDRDETLAAINRKLDIIGGFLAGQAGVDTPEPFTNLTGEDER